ncbi:hypothetical protein GQX73_g1938 [Xylaria multiplex]|uniref:Uncharacterized protein n=1 Tax=Xylaria multiplex TaxID=323545 RepID=A0A7C8MYN9_9PEZI|nr:hypothetical protein GQX73_g1938 [Xylaria multiplex]
MEKTVTKLAQQLNSLPYKYRSKGNGESHRQSSSAHRGSSSVRSEKHRPHHGYYTSSKDPAWEPVTDPRDVARWESQKPAVGWEYTDGTLNACNQFYTSWKYEEQAEARHAVQRQWEREHQDVEARQQEFEARKAAEEREWAPDATATTSYTATGAAGGFLATGAGAYTCTGAIGGYGDTRPTDQVQGYDPPYPAEDHVFEQEQNTAPEFWNGRVASHTWNYVQRGRPTERGEVSSTGPGDAELDQERETNMRYEEMRARGEVTSYGDGDPGPSGTRRPQPRERSRRRHHSRERRSIISLTNTIMDPAKSITSLTNTIMDPAGSIINRTNIIMDPAGSITSLTNVIMDPVCMASIIKSTGDTTAVRETVGKATNVNVKTERLGPGWTVSTAV